MQVRIEGLDVQIPQGYQDSTDYKFASKDKGEWLEVFFLAEEGPWPPFEELAARAKQFALDGFDDEHQVEVVDEQSIELAGHRAATQILAFEENEQRFEYAAVHIDLGPHRFASLEYYRPTDQPETEDVWPCVLETFQCGREPAEADLPNGFVRRRARDLSFALPKRLLPPQWHTFETQDEESLLAVAVYPDPAQPDGHMPRPMSDEIAEDAERGAILEAKDLPLPEGSQVLGQFKQYVLVQEDSRRLVHRALVFLPEGWRVHLDLEGPQEARENLEATWAEVVNTLVHAERGQSDV